MTKRVVWTSVALFCFAAAPGRTQDRVVAPRGPEVALSLGLGASVGESASGAAFRFGLERALTNRVRLELAGAYLDRGLGAQAWNAFVGARLDLADAGEKVRPFFAAGAGLYRASFEWYGAGGPEGPGPGWPAAAAVTCPYGNMPRFYARRMGELPPGGRWPQRPGFTDPMVVLGGGVRWDVSARLFVVPEVRALLVTGDGDTLSLGVFTLNVGYRF
jgi:hypothetical protein